MIFKLRTAGDFYTDEQASALKALGFTFVPRDATRGVNPEKRWFITDGTPTIEFNTLEELIDFQIEWKCIVIKAPYIEIYDDYRE